MDEPTQEQHASDQVAPGAIPAALAAAQVVRCPCCSYELRGLRDARCPECGWQITEADVRDDARRRVFLELTRWSVYVWGALMLLPALLVTWGVLAIPLAAGIAAAWVAPAGTPRGLVRRVRRRVWLLGLPWLYLPWLCMAIAVPVADWLYQNTSVLDWTDGEYIEYIPEILGPGGVGAGLLISYLVGALLWRLKLRRLAKAAGLAGIPGYDPFPWRSAATRMAVLPIGVVLLFWTLTAGSMQLLDALVPNWGTGW